jgi:catechol 2,3-dioxygenase-like lactoylglutathione lyase family enzyme
MTGQEQTALRNIGAITLFVENLAATQAFYADALRLSCVFEHDNSAVFDLGNTVLNLLDVREAPELISPGRVAGPAGGARCQFTIWVEDADAICAELRSRGVSLLNGPQDRPWGQRTAAFADPAGHVWEVAQHLPR